MKTIKKLLFLLLFIPFIVNAEDCLVVSGDGKTIGDEIACGNEHFYIIDVNETSVKALAKYNLNVGDKIDVFDINDDTIYTAYEPIQSGYELFRQARTKCETVAGDLNFDNVRMLWPVFTEVGQNSQNSDMTDYKLTSCRVYMYMNEDHVKQDPRAVGTKLDGNGKSILPLYGITYMNNNWNPSGYANINYDENGDLILQDTIFDEYLYEYYMELQDQGFVIDDISFIKLSSTLTLLKAVSGQDIEVVLRYDDVNNTSADPIIRYTGKMDIKEYVPDRYNWIYSITYWLGSGFFAEPDEAYEEGENDYFVSNEGLLCAIGRGICKYLPYPIGNGVRPVITLSVENIIDPFKITTQTEGKGNVEVVSSAYADDQITFRAIPEKNYKIKYVIVTDKLGNSVTFKEDQLIQNEDGTISINSFTMPSSDVVIKVGFELINPKTGVSRPVIAILFGLMLSGFAYYALVKKEQKSTL